VAAYRDHDNFQDVVARKRKALYFIAEADLARNTLLTLSTARQENDNTNSWGGLPTASDGNDLKLPRSTFLGNDWEYRDKKSTSAFASLEHRLDNDWKLNFSVNHIQADVDLFSTIVVIAPASYNQRAGQYFYEDERTSYEAHASGPFRFLNREHELALGVSRRTGDFDGHGGIATIFNNMDLRHWRHDLVARPNINLGS
jgi:outer membrane receptor for ferric coprogen and ferric-rhodotorulic acid